MEGIVTSGFEPEELEWLQSLQGSVTADLVESCRHDDWRLQAGWLCPYQRVIRYILRLLRVGAKTAEPHPDMDCRQHVSAYNECLHAEMALTRKLDDKNCRLAITSYLSLPPSSSTVAKLKMGYITTADIHHMGAHHEIIEKLVIEGVDDDDDDDDDEIVWNIGDSDLMQAAIKHVMETYKFPHLIKYSNLNMQQYFRVDFTRWRCRERITDFTYAVYECHPDGPEFLINLTWFPNLRSLTYSMNWLERAIEGLEGLRHLESARFEMVGILPSCDFFGLRNDNVREVHVVIDAEFDYADWHEFVPNQFPANREGLRAYISTVQFPASEGLYITYPD
jgi:hypothetical protein